MKTRLLAALTALSLSAFAGISARADEPDSTLEWLRPGYVMDVILVQAPRPEAATAAAGEIVLASQEPGYVQEVVVVRANRSEVLARARGAALQAALERQALAADSAGRALGTPAR